MVQNDTEAGSVTATPLRARPDWATVAAVAVVVDVSTTLIHEGLGHGGACLLMGCTPRLLTSMQFQGDEQLLSSFAVKVISAAGSIANLAAGVLAILLLRRNREEGPGTRWFFLWLFATVNLLQAAGYPLYSGLGNIGDWAVVVAQLRPVWLWRILLTVFGAYAYWAVTRWAMGRLGQHLSASPPGRVAEAYRYTLVPYVTGGLLSVAAGLLDPGGLVVVLISGVAASLGGTSALAWGPQLLHDPRLGIPTDIQLRVTRDMRWIVVAALVAIAFVLVLGPGIPRGAGP
jgi:hypothetical protein